MKKRKGFSTLALLVVTLCFFSFITPQQEDWQLIGQRKVNFVKDKDEITVTTTQPLNGIRILAKDRAIGISEVEIHFASGDKLQPSIDEIVKKGEQSSIIDLGTEGKVVTKISLKYRTIGSVLKGRGGIQVFGITAAKVNR